MSEKHTAVVGNIPDCLFCCTQLAFVYFSPIIHFLYYLFFLEYVLCEPFRCLHAAFEDWKENQFLETVSGTVPEM